MRGQENCREDLASARVRTPSHIPFASISANFVDFSDYAYEVRND
jgi:hypothetical protein